LSSLSVQNQNIAISFDAVPLQLRIANALVSYVRYVAKMIWPHNLAVYYPYPDSIPLWQGAASAVFLIGVSILVIRVFKRRPYLALGWFWYLGTLIPVSGLVQAGLWPAIADRWAYVPLIGLFIMIVWGGADLLRRWRDKALSLAIAVGAILICLLVSARIQAGYWADSVTLFQRALAVTGSTWIAHNNLGNALAVQGKLAEAIRHFHLSLQNNPPYPEEVYYNLASTLVSQGKLAEAIKIYAKALELNPDFVAAHINLGSAYAQHGKIIKAINHYSEALRLAPNSAEAHLNMGNGLLAQQRADEAIDHFYRAVQLDSNRAESHNALGLALLRKGKIEDAIFHFQTAYELKPYFKAAHLNLTLALSNNEKLKQAAENMQKALNFKLADPDLKTKIKDLLEKKKALDQAINRFQKSLFRQPGFTEIDTEDLSIVSETKKRYDGKLDLFRKIIEQLPDNAEAYYHLACIYARQGKIVESIKWLDKAISSGFNRWDLIETDSDLDYIRKSSHYSKWVKS
jgi:tetratricopeptide (TPR) repeat protein